MVVRHGCCLPCLYHEYAADREPRTIIIIKIIVVASTGQVKTFIACSMWNYYYYYYRLTWRSFVVLPQTDRLDR